MKETQNFANAVAKLLRREIAFRECAADCALQTPTAAIEIMVVSLVDPDPHYKLFADEEERRPQEGLLIYEKGELMAVFAYSDGFADMQDPYVRFIAGEFIPLALDDEIAKLNKVLESERMAIYGSDNRVSVIALKTERGMKTYIRTSAVAQDLATLISTWSHISYNEAVAFSHCN